jgi:transcriptional regulator with XRE-family HTH domain
MLKPRAGDLGQRYGNDDYNIPLSRLSDIETKGIIPSIHRLYALAVIYRVSFEELLSWYGVNLSRVRDRPPRPWL